MGKVLIFIFDNMTDYEITFISHLLGADGGFNIITIAYEDRIIKSRSGIMYKPLRTVSDILSDYDENIDGIIITGGWYGDARPQLLNLINKIYNDGKLVAGICGAGTVFLAKSGILANKKYTTPISEWTQTHIDVFGNNDPFPRNNYISKRVVQDGNVVTAQGIAFIDFAVEICDWFNLFEDDIEKDTFYRNFYRNI
ncbi:MAG: DJ-1/PfpI family protein [Clostridium sp.]